MPTSLRISIILSLFNTGSDVMFILNYDTAYCKGHLWILVMAFSEREAVEKLHSLINDVSSVRSILKQW